MDTNNNERGNIAISYLFAGKDVIQNIDIERAMKNDLLDLAMKWEHNGYIRKFVIADDDILNPKIAAATEPKLFVDYAEILPNEIDKLTEENAYLVDYQTLYEGDVIPKDMPSSHVEGYRVFNKRTHKFEGLLSTSKVVVWNVSAKTLSIVTK